MEKGEEKIWYSRVLLTSPVTKGTHCKVLNAEFVKQTERGVAIEPSVQINNPFGTFTMKAVLITVSMATS